ncbi:MAG: 23S rRNA (uracil1939-C5)-methyltransferase [Gammaproteobacteria bacterium]
MLVTNPLKVSLKKEIIVKRQKRREPYPIDIENLSHEGRGIGHVDGKAVFVTGALPGEKVIARTLRRKGSFDEAIVEEIVEASPLRIEPLCKYATLCGGCSMQHMTGQHQIEHKESVLFELFQHQAGLAPRIRLPALRGPEWGYRRKARLGVKFVPKKGGALVGFREKAAPYIADIESCEVLHPTVGHRLMELRTLVNGLSIRSRVPQIEVAIGDQAVALVFRHLEPFTEADLNSLGEFQNHSEIGIYLQPGGENTVHPLNAETATLNYTVHGIKIDFKPTDFTQVNGEMNRAMIDLVIEKLAINDNDQILDLFCGLGNFSLPMASHARTVLGVEGSIDLINRARDNATTNKVGNCTFAHGDLADPAELERLDMRGVTKLLLDPPRTGADAIVTELKFDSIERVVYVSCNPVTLARDAKALVERHGFELSSAGVMDMFPHTAHVESIAIFDRR